MSVCVVLRAREKRQRERQTNTESEESNRYRERDSSRNRSYHARTHAREKEIGNGELPVLPSRRSSPQNAHQRTEQNRTYAPRLLFFLAQSPASRFTSPVFLDVRMRTGKASREKRQFLSCSLSLLSISHFTLSHGSAAPYGPSLAVAGFPVIPAQETQAAIFSVTHSPSRGITLLHV